MQIVLGNRGDYAVRAVLYLARHPGWQRRSEISDAMDIPDKYLPQILGALVSAGIARSRTGRRGGYELSRASERVSLRDVVEAAEGPLQADRCLLRGGPCHWVEKCALHDAWTEAGDALSEHLAATTFDELARRDEDLERASTLSGSVRVGAHAPLIHEPRRGTSR